MEIDNNGSERVIKPFVIGCIRWVFSNTAKASIYSIIETAKAKGLIVEKYLVYLFEMLFKIDVTNKEIMFAIMPWSNDLPKELRASKRK